MSIQDAIVQATRDILSSYLAPELVEQLIDDIIHRIAPDIETALNDFAGFDFTKNSTRKSQANNTTRKVSTRGRKRRETSATDTGDDMDNGLTSDMTTLESEPSAEQMS